MSPFRVVASNSPEDAAWAAFDAAALRMHMLYAEATRDCSDTTERRKERLDAATDAARLWDEWRDLFLNEDDPNPGAAA